MSNWERDQVYIKQHDDLTIGMWWHEYEGPDDDLGMWRMMEVLTDGTVEYSEPTVSHGPGAYRKGWTLLANPHRIIRDKLCDSDWIARI